MKYAIYQNSAHGLTSKLYLEFDYQLKPYPFIKKESLPVIIQYSGSYSSFYIELEKKNGFLKWIETDGEPLTFEQRFPKNHPEFEYGWIDLEGNTYNVEHERHSISASYICDYLNYKTYQPESYLEKQGWIKVTGSWKNGTLVKKMYVDNFFITKKQADTLFLLKLDEVDHFDFIIRESKERW